MSEADEKEELQELINLLYNNHLSQYGKRKLEVYIKKQQKELEKKDHIIDLMADKLSEYTCWNKDDLNMNKLVPIKDIIDYFTNKADEQNG